MMTFPFLAGALFFGIFNEVSKSFEKMRAYAEANPDSATITRGAGSYHIEINDPSFEPGIDMGALATYALAIGIVAIALYAAAISRRLHDVGRSGWWSVIPAVLFLISGTSMSLLWGGTEGGQKIVSFMGVWAITMGYNICVIALIIFCALPGQPHANRFGEPPNEGADQSPG